VCGRALKLGLRSVHDGLVGSRVDGEEKVALFDLGSFLEMHLVEIA
jgi:hypothetical protein